jgi:gliding motility-associated-like protein
MRKLYSFILTTLIFTNLYSQSGLETIQAIKISDHRYQFVNKTTGQVVNNLTWNEAESFANGFAKVFTGKKWGFVDETGSLVIPAKFELLRNFSNHMAAALQNSKWGFIDEKGKTVIPFDYDIAFDFTESVTAVFKNNKWLLINRQGAIVKPLNIDVFYGFKNGIANIVRRGRNGQMNTKGEIISLEPEKNVTPVNKNTTASRPGSAQALPCPPNIGFDFGNFTNWSCFIGGVTNVSTNNVITVNPSPPTANRHVIYARNNPSDLDPYGLFPINPPDGSGFALKLGNNVNGAEAERVSYQINVPANAVDYSITYRYAVVFQDPGHLRYEQPRFIAKILDVAANKYLTCASYEYVADDTIPGFYNSPVDAMIKCKTWTSVFVNLSAHAGKTLLLEFTSVDCTLGAHWGYTYVDVGDCNIAADVQYQCNPDIANLIGPPGFLRYRWWNSDYTSIVATGRTPVLNPGPKVNSTLHLEVMPANGIACSDTLHVALVKNAPTADAGPDTSICPGSSAKIGVATDQGNIYSWAPTDYLSNPNIASPISRPPVTTTYIVTVRNAANECESQDTVTVFVNPVPEALFDPSPNQCITENNFSFNNNSTGATTYTWSFGDGNSSTQANPGYSYANAGTYNVKLIAANIHGCKDSISHPVTIYANPVITAVNDASICLGRTVQLRATGGQTYEWSPSQALSCTDCAAPVASPTTSTSYYVRGISSQGCSGFDTVNITVHQPIQITVSPDQAMCQTESVNLLASGAASYRWTPAQTLSSDTASNPVATPTATTNYRVVGFDGHNCFTDTGYVRITVNPKPTIELGPDKTLLTGTVYPLAPVVTGGPIATWQWTPTTNLSCTACSNPSATIKTDITYDVAIENIYGCTATDKINIKAFCENTQVFIPNAFTPDGDGVNDILMVRAKGIEVVNSFRIFSRWGELLFEKLNFPPNSIAYGWDGKIKGKTGAPEVYVYTVEVTCDNLQTYTYKGNVSILK